MQAVYSITGKKIEVFVSEENLDTIAMRKDIELKSNISIFFGIYDESELELILLDPETCERKYELTTEGKLTDLFASMSDEYSTDLLASRWLGFPSQLKAI